MAGGIIEGFNEVIENPYAITSTFEVIKNFFNEFMFFAYFLSFFLLFLVFLLLTFGLFIYLPIKLISNLTRNKNVLRKLFRFDISLFRISLNTEGVSVRKVKTKKK